MKATEEILQNVGETTEYARQYTKKQIEYVQLLVAERTAKVTSILVTSLAVTFIGLLIVIMLSFTLGFYLGDLFESYPIGFLCVTGIYLLLGIIIYSMRQQLVTNPILTKIIKAMLD